MKESIIEQPATEAAAECCAEVDQCVRRNPGSALLFTLGAGLLIGLLIRALRPAPSPKARVAQLLEDLEWRLRDAAEPTLRKANAFASDGASAVHDGLNRGEAQLDRLLRDARKRIRKFLP